MKKKTFEEEQQIISDYKELKSSTKVAEKFGISPQTVRNVLARYGEPVRTYGKRTSKTPTTKVCRKCGRKSDNTDARFCWFCGTDMRSPLEVALNDFSIVFRSVCKFAPAEMTDEAIKNWNFVIKEVREVADIQS